MQRTAVFQTLIIPICFSNFTENSASSQELTTTLRKGSITLGRDFAWRVSHSACEMVQAERQQDINATGSWGLGPSPQSLQNNFPLLALISSYAECRPCGIISEAPLSFMVIGK